MVLEVVKKVYLGVSFKQFEWAPSGCGPVHDLSRVDEVGHGSHHLLQRAVGVVLVDNQQVNILQAEV